MAPTTKDIGRVLKAEASAESGERVVISGMSGLYPSARHVPDLANILYNKINPISSEDSRWEYDHPEVAQFVGKLPELELFDAQFFKVHYRLSNSMDSMGRKVLEQAYQAIYDAGVSPEQLYGKKVGVYIGSCFSETEKACFYVASSRTGFGIAGCNKSMFANRISYWLNAKGPSMSVDDACCSSTVAVELAYQAIAQGECEAAIVGGANLCLHPQSSIHYGRIMKLSKDGTTKSFDENAAGCAKSEAINVLFLQKAKDARRIYAEIIHVKTEFTSILEDEMGPKYGFYREHVATANFLKRFYDEVNIPTQAIEYVEAFGSAVPEADKVELEVIDEVLCKDRKDPLLVGSVMSNIGYAEAASGITAITKVLLGYHTGKLAANMHCDTPRSDVAALRDGRMQVVRDHTPFRRTYVAVNGLSVTGVNAHLLLHGHYKPKDLSRYKSNIPYLVTLSGRQDSSVTKILNDLKSRPIDPEELALFHNIHETKISGHLGKGFIILDKGEDGKTVSLHEKVDYFDDIKRPLWFVYSGMGSQWAGMGAQLMRIPIFAAAIERCRRVLEPKGVDIVHIITSPDKTIFDNILASFVGIAAVQIGLTDVLREIGLVPDKIIGHSVGELGCAYADGCFTAEEMILSAYSRGLVSVETPFIKGSMAAVGIGFQQISDMCPPEIEVACHNGPDSCTISGPANVMREFVAHLTSKNIFAKEVPCSNIAYHSRYIAEAGPGLLKYLSEVIKSPKPRSDRWLSTSVPIDQWSKERAKYSSAEYHTNNLLNPVLFEETSRLIPANAVLVEVAPHGLLQAILKRSLPDSCRNIPLTRRGHPDNARSVLQAIGQLYMQGYYPRVHKLYPKVEFPVSTGTPMLSHLVEWAHQERWNLPLYVSAFRKTAAATKFVLSIHDSEHRYLQGNVVKGKTVYPFAAALVAVWDTLAMVVGAQRQRLDVQFRDVVLHSQPVLHDRRLLRVAVSLHRGTGRFEVMDDKSIVASGFVKSESMNSKNMSPLTYNSEDELDQNTIYQMLFARDFSYRDEFRSIHSADPTFSQARVSWRDNWVTLIDAMLQLNVLRHPHGTISQPDFIRSMKINVSEHKDEQLGGEMVKIVNVCEDITRCKGVVMENINLRHLPLTADEDKTINLKTLKFVPHFQPAKTDFITTMHVYLQLVAENINKNEINILEIVDENDKPSKFSGIKNVLGAVPRIKGVYRCVEREKILEEKDNFLNDVDLLLVSDLSMDDHLCQTLYRVLPADTFVANKEDTQVSTSTRPTSLYRVVCSHNVASGNLELARWRPTSRIPTGAISVHSPSDLDLLSATQATLLPRQKLLVLSAYPPIPGLKDLIHKWRKQNDRKIVLAMINHKISEDQHLEQIPNLDLVFNILDHGTWGGEYYVPMQQNANSKGNVTLSCSRIGDLNSLNWIQAPKTSTSGVKVNIHYAGINDIDVKRALGTIPFYRDDNGDEGFGMDFSGVTETGERVMGIVQQGAVNTSLKVNPNQLWPVPAHWSLEDAATVPLAYCLAYYCLSLKCMLYPGKRVLVHGGAGALGQAAISIALAHQCEVFATVSSVAKKRFLLRIFPDIKAENVGNSRDTSFGDMILDATLGKGVDIVMSCVKGELKTVSLKCVGKSSFIFDVVQIHNRENYDFGMYYLSNERGYIRVDLRPILNDGNCNEMKKLQRLVGEGIARGWVRPLSRMTYAPSDVTRAFRLLAAGNQRGRILLQMRQINNVLTAEPRLQCSSDMYHVIISNDDLITLQLAEKLVSRGVRKLLLHRLNKTLNLQFKLRDWNEQGVLVHEAVEPDSKNILNLLNQNNIVTSTEGIYVIRTNCEKSNVDLLPNVNMLTAHVVPSLKYLAVATTDFNFKISPKTQNNVPVTVVRLPAINKMDDVSTSSNGQISTRQAVEIIENAICSAEGVVQVHINVSPRASILKRVSEIIDINIPEDVKNTTSLSDLGMDVEKSNALHVFLRENYNASLPEEDMLKVTVQMMVDIENAVTDDEYENVKGLKSLFSYVDSDELLATTEMVFLPTLSSGSSMRGDEFDVKQSHLYIVPGVEGHHSRFRALCERLKLPALVLQPGLHRPHETVQELARRYAKILVEKTGLKTNFYLLGYESGVLVALEIAALLEEQGLTGTVFCIGAPPEEFKTEFRELLSEYDTTESLQDAIIRHMFTLMSGCDAAELDGALQNVRSWQEKIEVTVRTLLGRVSHSAQYARQLIEAAYGRVAQLLSYDGKVKGLRSKLVMLRPATDRMCQDQGYTTHRLRAPLAHATNDLRCATIINSNLHPDILKAFECKNMCETYLMNADSFMTNANTAK